VTGPSRGRMDPEYMLPSSCVTIPDRLIIRKGVCCTEFTTTEQFGAHPCTKLEDCHIGARQIFPLLKYGCLTLPTVKHHCDRTSLASSLRACSNMVKPDPIRFHYYSEWWKIYAQDFVNDYEREEHVINLETYLSKYPEAYRAKIRQGIDNDHIRHKLQPTRYKAFSKIELQFTEVSTYDKETHLNKVKERQICGPSEQKKAYANAFINELEFVAHKYEESYCGRQNWPEICESLDRAEIKYGSLVWAEADGSGFDMTQLSAHNLNLNDLIMACAKSWRTEFQEPLSAAWVQEALESALPLRVTMENGNIKYTTEGRASGDGWTTFGNTMLMISYYKYALHTANITKYALKVKGDDVLLGVRACDAEKFERAHRLLFTYDKNEKVHGLGQISDPIVWKDLIECSFLSNHFFRDSNERLRLTRIPPRVIQTICWSTKIPPGSTQYIEQLRKDLCFSKGKCLEAWASDLPIFGVLGRKMVEVAQGGNFLYSEYGDEPRFWSRKFGADYEPYCVYLEQRYGISRRVIESIEAKIMAVNTITGFVEVEELRMFFPNV